MVALVFKPRMGDISTANYSASVSRFWYSLVNEANLNGGYVSVADDGACLEPPEAVGSPGVPPPGTMEPD